MRQARPVFDRIFARVEPDSNGGCWLWGGAQKNGYGHIIMPGGKTTSTHRAMYQAVRGEIPEGLCVCHRCDVRACVNPDHLWLGTHADNAADKEAKGPKPKVERNCKAKMSEADVVELRALRSEGVSLKDIAKRFGVTSATAGKAARGDTWK